MFLSLITQIDSNRLKTELSNDPTTHPSPPLPQHPSSSSKALQEIWINLEFRNFLVQILNIWPNATAHFVSEYWPTKKFLKLGTSQGGIWNQSDPNPPFPFSIFCFRPEKKLPFRFSTNGNKHSFETQVFQTGFIALCTIHSNILYLTPSTVEYSKYGAVRSPVAQSPTLLQAPANEQRGHSPLLELPTGKASWTPD